MHTDLFNKDKKSLKVESERRLIFYEDLSDIDLSKLGSSVLTPKHINMFLLLQMEFSKIYYLKTKSGSSYSKLLANTVAKEKSMSVLNLEELDISPYDILVCSKNAEFLNEDFNTDLYIPKSVIFKASLRCDWFDSTGKLIARRSTYDEVCTLCSNSGIRNSLKIS